MTTLGDFSSLLSIGIGIGIGLSLFRAPVDLRVSRITRSLQGELGALAGMTTPFAQSKRRDMLDLRMRFRTIQNSLESRQMPFMVIAVVGALLNLAGLIFVTLFPDGTPTPQEVMSLLFISVGWFLLLLAALEILARAHLSSIIRQLREIQRRRAPPIELPPKPLF